MPSMLLLPFALTVATADSAPVRIELQHPYGLVAAGQPLRAHVSLGADGYLVVLRTDSDGRVRVMFPTRPTATAYVTAGAMLELHGYPLQQRYARWGSRDAGYVMAILSARPFDFTPLLDAPGGTRWSTGGVGKSYYYDRLDLHALAERLVGGTDYMFDVAAYRVGADFGQYRPYSALCDYGYGNFSRLGYWGRTDLMSSFWDLDAPLYDPFFDPYSFGYYTDPYAYSFGYAGYGYGYGYGSGCYPRGGYYIPGGIAIFPFEPEEPEERWGDKLRRDEMISLKGQLTARGGKGATVGGGALPGLRTPKPEITIADRNPRAELFEGWRDRVRDREVARDWSSGISRDRPARERPAIDRPAGRGTDRPAVDRPAKPEVSRPTPRETPRSDPPRRADPPPRPEKPEKPGR